MNLRMNRKRTKANDILSQEQEQNEESEDDYDLDEQDDQAIEHKSSKKFKGNNGKAQRAPLAAVVSQKNTSRQVTAPVKTLVSTTEKSMSITSASVRSFASESLLFSQQILNSKESQNDESDILPNDDFLELSINDLHTQLQEVLLTKPTVILRGGADKLGFNANPKELFDFDNVIANHSEISIQCRVQDQIIYDSDISNKKNYPQETFNMSLQEYGEYTKLLDEANYEQIKNKSYYKKHLQNLPTNDVIISAVNISMDDALWQLENMRFRCSLPQFVLNKGKYDLLAYHRQDVSGYTQPQMCLSVTGAWTQECSAVRVININHGDGENIWYCIDADQVEKYREYVKAKHNIDIYASQGMWFGCYQDTKIANAGIQIKKVTQKKGDIVILGPGVLHWVRSAGKTVQTTWKFSFRTESDILVMHERYLSNQDIHIPTRLLNKTLFMDLLNFEYYTLDKKLTGKLLEIVQEYYEKELEMQNTLINNNNNSNTQHEESSTPVSIWFYEQLPAQLRQLQIYYCSVASCHAEIFSYFGVLRSQFTTVMINASRIPKHKRQHTRDISSCWNCEYFCARCLIKLKSAGQEIVILRRFDLHSLLVLLERVREYLAPKSSSSSCCSDEGPALFPLEELTNVNHFCGQIQHANDFIFNKDVQKLEQLHIPDLYLRQGLGQMQRHQLDMQEERGGLLGFQSREIEKFKAVLNRRQSNHILQNNNYSDEEGLEKILEKVEYKQEEGSVERQGEQGENAGDGDERIKVEVENIDKDKTNQQKKKKINDVAVRNDKKIKKNKKKKKSKKLGVKVKMALASASNLLHQSSMPIGKKKEKGDKQGSNLKGKQIKDKEEQDISSNQGEVINGKISQKEKIEKVSSKIITDNISERTSSLKIQGISDVVMVAAKQLTGVQVPAVVLEQGKNRDKKGQEYEDDQEQEEEQGQLKKKQKQSKAPSNGDDGDSKEKSIQKKIKKKISKKKGSLDVNIKDKKSKKKKLKMKIKENQVIDVVAAEKSSDNDIESVINVENKPDVIIKSSSKTKLTQFLNGNHPKKSILLNGHNSNRNQNHSLTTGNLSNGGCSMETSQQQLLAEQQQHQEGEIHQKQLISGEEPKKRVRFLVADELPHVSQVSNRKQMLKEQVLQQEFLAKQKELEEQAKRKEKNKKQKKKVEDEGQHNNDMEKEKIGEDEELLLILGLSEEQKEESISNGIVNGQGEEKSIEEEFQSVDARQGQEIEQTDRDNVNHEEVVDAAITAENFQSGNNIIPDDYNTAEEGIAQSEQPNSDDTQGEIKRDDQLIESGDNQLTQLNSSDIETVMKETLKRDIHEEDRDDQKGDNHTVTQ